MLSGTDLHSCFCALSSCLSESAFNFYRLLGYGGQEVFAAACLWVIFSKLKRGAGKKNKKFKSMQIQSVTHFTSSLKLLLTREVKAVKASFSCVIAFL